MENNSSMEEFYLNNDESLVMKQLDHLASAASNLSDINLFHHNQQHQQQHQTEEEEVPQRSAARLGNREVMIYRERLAASMSSAKKQTITTGPRHRRGYSTDDASSVSESIVFSDSHSVASSDSDFSSPASSPKQVHKKSYARMTNNSVPHNTKGVRVIDPIDSICFDDDDEDLTFFEEIGEASLCHIDSVISISAIHNAQQLQEALTVY